MLKLCSRLKFSYESAYFLKDEQLLMNIAIRGAPATSSALPPIQRQLRDDWDNRECIEVIAHHVKKITDFLNQFGWSYNLSVVQSN